MAAVVSDSSVLIGLASIGQFSLLATLYQEVLVPDSVWREVTSGPADFIGAKETAAARAAGWLKVVVALNRPLVTQLEATLDPGEAESIALAVERSQSLLLIDESDGRRVARKFNLQLTGTIGILLRAKAEAHVPALKPLLKELVERRHFRLGIDLYREVIAEAGEQP